MSRPARCRADIRGALAGHLDAIGRPTDHIDRHVELGGRLTFRLREECPTECFMSHSLTSVSGEDYPGSSSYGDENYKFTTYPDYDMCQCPGEEE